MADYTIEELQDMLEEKLIKEEQEFQAQETDKNWERVLQKESMALKRYGLQIKNIEADGA